jgi:hypothetical protein
LPFLYIDGSTRFGSGSQQIGLPAKKSRDLQHVDLFAGDLRFSRRMNVCCSRNFQLASNSRENLATFAHFNSAK